ncbi:MAG TPA: hypothetical protein VMA53_23940 [Stellaceae bacterium]|nr:hypothetical protein [Stellaceae bacterium]
MTWSIVARDGESGAFGVAIATAHCLQLVPESATLASASFFAGGSVTWIHPVTGIAAATRWRDPAAQSGCAAPVMSAPA